MAKKEKSTFNRISKIITFAFNIAILGMKFLVFLFFLLILSSIVASIIPAELETGNVAVIPIKGLISTNAEQQLLGGISSQTIVELIEKAEDISTIKGIILEIDSPGGTPVASDEIASAVKKAEKPVVAVIRETGASGAYWIASAADKIYANRMSMTGSIGVRASRLEFAGFIQDHNITYRRLVAGKYKDAGNMWKEMTEEEQALYQKMLDDLHEEFIQTVSKNRKMPEEQVRELATGFVFLGREAKELGLIDELGAKDDAVKYLEDKLNITAETVIYKKKGTLFEEMAGISSEGFYNIGQGIGSVFKAEEQVKFSLS